MVQELHRIILAAYVITGSTSDNCGRKITPANSSCIIYNSDWAGDNCGSKITLDNSSCIIYKL